MSTVLDGGLTKSEFWALAHLPGEAELLTRLRLRPTSLATIDDGHSR